MSSKKSFDDWVQHVGESALPADEFTFTEGSNYGLDGFGFDKRMNEGVLRGARLPSVRGLSGLPDGFVGEAHGSELPSDDLRGERQAFNLSTMLSEEEGALPISSEVRAAAQVVDLSWLDPTQKQDPKRLPKGLHPEVENANASIKELEEAWGAGRQTTGLELVPNTNEQEATQYKREITLGPKSGQPGVKTASPEDIRDAVLHAMRRSAFGHPLSEIKAEVAQLLGKDAYRAKKAMALVESEHGLVGKVFIRAAAFPGIKNGRWVKEIRKAARTARYIITDDPVVADKLKMVAVSEIPWKKALAHYRPVLQASGYRLASSGSPQDVLKAAFREGPQASATPGSFKPVEVKPADLVTAAEAKAEFYASPVTEREVVDSSEKAKKASRRKALVRLARWVRAGLIDQKVALKLHSSDKSAEEILREGARLVAASQKTASYKGTVFKVASGRQADSAPLGRDVDRVVGFARRQITEGLAGSHLDSMLKAKYAKPLLKAASSRLRVLRDEHEGLAGHLYVDAQAYMTKTGTAGCEEGALKHRTNGIKYVLASDRCTGCIQVSEGMCKVYKKALAVEPPTKDPKAYQRKVLAATKATDAEITASYFDHSEYDLSSPLESFDLEDTAPVETLGEILFGEIEV